VRIKVRVRRYEQFGRLAHRFRDAANGDLQRDAANELHAASHPVLAAVRASVLAAEFPVIPEGARDTPSKGLRARLAAATHVTPLPQGNGVRFFVEGTQVDPRWGRRLSKLTDKELAPRWRHPTFARDPWVTQHGRPWFFTTIRPARPSFEAGIHRAMQRTARKITGGR
jgi:hypothetical protein